MIMENRITYKLLQQKVAILNCVCKIRSPYNDARFGIDSAHSRYMLVIYENSCIMKAITGYRTAREVFRVIEGILSITNLIESEKITLINN